MRIANKLIDFMEFQFLRKSNRRASNDSAPKIEICVFRALRMRGTKTTICKTFTSACAIDSACKNKNLIF